MSKKKVKVTEQPMDHDVLGDLADAVWSLSTPSSADDKEAAAAKLKSMGVYFAKPINVSINKKGE